MTYTPDSPAVRKALATYAQRPGSTEGRMAAALNQHKRGLRDKLATEVAANAILEAKNNDLAEQVSELTDLLEVARDAVVHPVPASVVLPEITDEDADAARQAWVGPHLPAWGSILGSTGEDWRAVARVLRDRLAASLPVWQPIEPGTVIKAGTRWQEHYADGTWSGGVALRDLRAPKSGVAVRVEVDPRTVPAEAEDPDRAAVEDMAQAHALNDGYDWDVMDERVRDNYRKGERAALAAYRAHDKEN